MRPTNHVILSGSVTAVFAIWVKSWGALGACFLSGIFIDLDHHLDYYLAKKELPLSYKKLVDFCRNDHQSKLYLFFHSYEMLFMLWGSIFMFHLNETWIGVAIGFTIHILCDEIFNPIKPMAYFLTYRLKNKFHRKCFIKKWHVDE